MTYETVTHPYVLTKHGITRDKLIDGDDMIKWKKYKNSVLETNNFNG